MAALAAACGESLPPGRPSQPDPSSRRDPSSQGSTRVVPQFSNHGDLYVVNRKFGVHAGGAPAVQSASARPQERLAGPIHGPFQQQCLTSASGACRTKYVHEFTAVARASDRRAVDRAGGCRSCGDCNFRCRRCRCRGRQRREPQCGCVQSQHQGLACFAPRAPERRSGGQLTFTGHPDRLEAAGKTPCANHQETADFVHSAWRRAVLFHRSTRCVSAHVGWVGRLSPRHRPLA